MSEETKVKLKDIFEWIYCIVIAVALALLIRYFVGTPTVVRMTSMYPTLKQGDRLIVNRTLRTFSKMPQRGDIITFEAPTQKTYDEARINNNNPTAVYERRFSNFITKFMYYVLEIKKESYVKRVIALPGEHVEIKEGEIYINNQKLEEEYLPSEVQTNAEGMLNDFVVPENCIFAIGDNRKSSSDSRMFGCIPLEKVEGKVVFRFWPLNKWGRI